MVIKIDNINDSKKKEIVEFLKSNVPDFNIIDEVIATKIWVKDDIRNAIEESGHVLSEDLVTKTIHNMGKMSALCECQDYEWDSINESIQEAYEERITDYGWIKTDDNQYLKKIKNGVYKLVQTTELPNNEYNVCANTIMIENWKDSDGMYDNDCKFIIQSYYESLERFESEYPDPEVREQILAEMIFESTWDHDYESFEVASDKLSAQKVLETLLFK